MVANDDEIKVIKKIKRLRKKKVSLRDIAAKLYKCGDTRRLVNQVTISHWVKWKPRFVHSITEQYRHLVK